MKLQRIFTYGVVAMLLFVGFGAVGVVAAHGNANPDHPACEGDKYKISSEGSDVGGEFAGSKWFVKSVCSEDQGKPDFHHWHEPDNALSVPENAQLDCHTTSRNASANFVDDAC